LIGIVSWMWMQIELFRAGFRAYRQCQSTGRREAANLIFITLAFAVLCLASCLGEDTMEKPYYTIPYYALWGFALRVAYQLRTAASPANPSYSAREIVGVSRPNTS